MNGLIMKNWFFPIAVLSVSGLGLLCASERARKRLHVFFERVAESGDPLGEFNKAMEDQLDTIQRTLERLSEALDTDSPRSSC
ncbi:MAG TPA: hypothetical protein VN176_11645 [Verrucomicrobiae bacterium]|nr:hypothetical protein [Verrucomicrobiae bacterium]